MAMAEGAIDIRYLALEIVAVPFGAVVDPLPLVVDEHHVARVAGCRRHPLLCLPLFSLLLASTASAGTGQGRAKQRSKEHNGNWQVIGS